VPICLFSVNLRFHLIPEAVLASLVIVVLDPAIRLLFGGADGAGAISESGAAAGMDGGSVSAGG
jgi:hypothetical protein